MPDITQTCKVSGKKFTVTEWEQELLKKFDAPLPTLCFEEALRRRLSHRNERKIYNSKCDLTGKPIISIYSPDKPYKVYSQDAWWGDSWDPKDYGRDYDFSRPFFEQFRELRNEVPHLSLMNTKAENSEYCNLTASNKNCYLVFGGDFNEDCYYSLFSMHSRDLIDVYWVEKSELVYDSIDCENCYDLKYSQNCNNCTESNFLYECRGCKNCFGCVNLRNKQYHIFNKPFTKEEYEKKLKEFRLDSWEGVQKMKKEFEEFKLRFPRRYAHIVNCENCTGTNLTNCKNCINSFGVTGPAEDFKDIFLAGFNSKDFYRSNHVGHDAELFYEMLGSIGGYHNAFCSFSWDCQETFYCDMVINSNNLFGCISMKRAEYCILNKQYSKENYANLKARIIEHMKSTKEWGEFFPVEDSVFAYNETVAQDYFPLTKQQVLDKGLIWMDEEIKEIGTGDIPPDSIHEVNDQILQKTFVCEKTGRPYKLNAQELNLYKKMVIPIPHYASETRNEIRISMRNPVFSYNRQCAKCSKKLTTTYSPTRPETIYCEECFSKEVY